MEIATSAPPTESSAPAEAPQATAPAGVTETSANAGQTTQPTPVEKLSIMGVEIEKSKVHPELLSKVENWNKAYTENTQKLSAAEKKSQALDQLSNHPGFQKWYWEQMNGGAKPTEVKKEDPYNLTPETQAELLSDPSKMRSYIEGLTKSVIDQYAQPAANEAKREAQTLRNEQTIEHLAEKHKDFDSLVPKISEKLAEYYQKNGTDLELEDAYWLAKRPFMESEAEIKAHQRVEEKVNGSTLPPSGAPPSGVKVIPGKGMSLDEKMRIAAEHAFRGEKIKFGS